MKLAPWEQGYDLKEEIKKLQHKARGRYSNDSGLGMEKMIMIACQQYEHNGRAFITKVPEPFRVLNKTAGGKASIQFTAHAQPDDRHGHAADCQYGKAFCKGS